MLKLYRFTYIGRVINKYVDCFSLNLLKSEEAYSNSIEFDVSAKAPITA